jgi:Coenzyme PQQ synthesis protein D (PqqD)
VTTHRWHRHPHVLWRRSLDAVLVLPKGSAEPVTLAGTGPEIWELLEEPCSIDVMVAVLAERHAADPVVVQRDVSQLLELLLQRGAVETLDPDG